MTFTLDTAGRLYSDGSLIGQAQIDSMRNKLPGAETLLARMKANPTKIKDYRGPAGAIAAQQAWVDRAQAIVTAADTGHPPGGTILPGGAVVPALPHPEASSSTAAGQYGGTDAVISSGAIAPQSGGVGGILVAGGAIVLLVLLIKRKR